MRPRKRFGQHFLHDQGVLQGMADAIRLKTGDRVMEIGPGQGCGFFRDLAGFSRSVLVQPN